MVYPCMTLSDRTEIVHSQMVEKDGKQKVIIHSERSIEKGFDLARYELPDYKRILKEGHSGEEIAIFEQLLRSNAHLLYKHAINEGIQTA